MSFRTFKIFWRVLFGLLAVSAIFIVWYNATYSMNEATSYSVNTPEMSKSLLILTQGSNYKDAVTKKVVDYFSARDVFIQVRDIGRIPEVDMGEWTVVVIMHTWEIGKPPAVVQELVDKGIDPMKFVFMTTSGDNESHIEGLDGVTGASVLDNVNTKSKEVIDRINQRIENGGQVVH